MLALGAGAAVAQDSADTPGFVVPGDTWFGEQWSLFGWGQTVGSVVETTVDVDVRAPEAWSITKGDPDVILAVLDTGVDYDHPDLTANLWTNPGETGDGRETNGVDDDGNGYVDDWRGWDFIDDDNDPSDVRGDGQSGELPAAHGTSLASIIAADDNDWGMVGLAPDITVMGLRATNGEDLGKAMQYAIDHGATITNMSLINLVPAFEFGFDDVHEVMLQNPEILYVAAAGNANWDNDILGAKPCSFEDVPTLICVAATDENDELATFFGGSSSYGATSVDLAAPGDNLLIAQPPLATPLMVDFEPDDLADWNTPQGGWTTSAAAGGNGTAAFIDIGDVPAEADGAALELSEPLDVSGLRDCRLSGRAFVDSERNASLWLEFQRTGSDSWGLSVGNAGFGTIQGTDGEWETFDLTIPNLEDELRFRFAARLRTGAEALGVGLAIDDVAVTCQGATEYTERNSFAYAEGTSYATPLTAAAAALVWSAYPELDALQVKQAVLDGAHPLPALDGVVATGARLDAYGALVAAGSVSDIEENVNGGIVSGVGVPDEPLDVPETRGGGVPTESSASDDDDSLAGTPTVPGTDGATTDDESEAEGGADDDEEEEDEEEEDPCGDGGGDSRDYAAVNDLSSLALDFVPVIGTAKGFVEAVSGCDYVTGTQLSGVDRIISILAAIAALVGLGGLLKFLAKSPKYAKYLKFMNKATPPKTPKNFSGPPPGGGPRMQPDIDGLGGNMFDGPGPPPKPKKTHNPDSHDNVVNKQQGGAADEEIAKKAQEKLSKESADDIARENARQGAEQKAAEAKARIERQPGQPPPESDPS